MTVSQLLANTTSYELSEWEVFFKIEAENIRREGLKSSVATGAQKARRG